MPASASGRCALWSRACSLQGPSHGACRGIWSRCWRNLSMRRKRGLGLALGVLVLLLVGAAWVGYYWLRSAYDSPGPSKVAVRIQVEQGASVHSTLARLANEGVVRNATAIKLYMRIAGLRP